MPDDAPAATAEVVPDPGRASAFLVRVDGADQSHVDLGDPTFLEFPYVQRIADVLDCLDVEGRLWVVHVGGAGMTLPRYLAARRPGTAQVVLEPDEALTALVRERLPLPPRSGIKVRPVDGRTGVAAMPDAYAHVVVVDAFAGARVPAGLVAPSFLHDVRRALRPGGVLVVNVADGAPFRWSARLLAGVREALGPAGVVAEPATLKGRRHGNLLVVAGAQVPWERLQRRAARRAFPYRVLDPDAATDRLGGGVSFTDDDAEPSPAPPGGATFFS